MVVDGNDKLSWCRLFVMVIMMVGGGDEGL